MILAYTQLAASMALVGVNVVVAKLLAEALPIPVIACLRCILAAAVLWPLMRLREAGPVPGRAVLGNLFWQAAFGTALYNLALLAGLRLTSALQGGLVLAALPAVIALGSALWLKERLAPRMWLAAPLAALAMAALTLARAGPDASGSVAGNALVLLAVCGEATYALLARRVAGRVGIVTASFWMQVFSAGLLLPLSLAIAPDLALGAIDGRIGALLVFHSLTASVLALLLWYGGLRRVEANVAGVFAALLPATAAVSAVVFLGERFGAGDIAGFAMMLASILLATWPRRRAYGAGAQSAGTKA